MAVNFTQNQILTAIENSGGIISNVANKLQCNWNTANKYIQKWASTKAALKVEREKNLDICETGLLEACKDRERWAIKFMLMTLGKERGYEYKTDEVDWTDLSEIAKAMKQSYEKREQ